MSQPKFASITGSLLARKGEAGPSADRRALLERWHPQSAPTEVALPPPPPMPKPPVVPRPEAPPMQAVAAPKVPAAVAPSASSSGASVKIALRISEAQHFRMRVAAAQLQVSRASLMSAALDHYLATVCAAGVPECRCLKASKACGCIS